MTMKNMAFCLSEKRNVTCTVSILLRDCRVKWDIQVLAPAYTHMHAHNQFSTMRCNKTAIIYDCMVQNTKVDNCFVSNCVKVQ